MTSNQEIHPEPSEGENRPEDVGETQGNDIREPDEPPQPDEAASEEATVDSAEETVETLKAELEEANRERGQYKTLLQRVQADFVNYKRRAEEEREELVQQASAAIIFELLSILDDLSLALDHPVAKTEQETSWLEGVKLIYRKLNALLEAERVSFIEAQGKPFDPWEHEALGQEESADHAEGTVLRVLRNGYKMRDRVLRPAQVIVAKRPEAADNDNDKEYQSEEV